jgi:glycosyltransferase involved in cell wall biosynthesis
MIRRADHVIAVSQATRDDVVRLTGYPEKQISVIYSGIDHTLFRPVAKDEAKRQLRRLHGLEKPFFIYASRLEHPGKNHIRLIQAFERFKLENDTAHQLVLAGADWAGAATVHARAAESPVQEDIVLTGYVPVYSLSLLYSGCDLMIYPSLYEGFGFPIVEALACGAPVICSETSSMQEIAGQLLPTFDPTRPEAICKAITKSVSKGWSAEERARGTDYAHRFDWRDTARRCVEVYNSVV